MVQSLPGFLNLSLNVCSPCQVLGDVYTEVLETAHAGVFIYLYIFNVIHLVCLNFDVFFNVYYSISHTNQDLKHYSDVSQILVTVLKIIEN